MAGRGFVFFRGFFCLLLSLVFHSLDRRSTAVFGPFCSLPAALTGTRSKKLFGPEIPPSSDLFPIFGSGRGGGLFLERPAKEWRDGGRGHYTACGAACEEGGPRSRDNEARHFFLMCMRGGGEEEKW